MASNNITGWLEARAINLYNNGIYNNEAFNLNIVILEIDPENTNAMNRLARWYRENNDFVKAEELYKQVLSIDPKNRLATRQLRELERNRAINLSKAKIANEKYVHHCWKCGRTVTSAMKRCPSCGWFVCDNCGSCGCGFRRYGY